MARGYRSSGALPLRIGAKVMGGLTLYAAQAGFFPDKEVAFLTSLADNLAFALESLDQEARRRQAEEDVKAGSFKCRSSEGLFSLPVQTIIYHIMQEALTNIGKHAHPASVTIPSHKKHGQVHFVVQDNVEGFNIQELSSWGALRGLGLAAMEE